MTGIGEMQLVGAAVVLAGLATHKAALLELVTDRGEVRAQDAELVADVAWPLIGLVLERGQHEQLLLREIVAMAQRFGDAVGGALHVEGDAHELASPHAQAVMHFCGVCCGSARVGCGCHGATT